MFVHLHCHSHYSFLRAVPSPAELAAAAAGHAMPAVALTDTNGLYAAVPFYLAARKADVKPIVGAVLDIELRNAESETRNSNADGRTADRAESAPLVLLATNHTGYSNLCRLVTERQLRDQPVGLEALNAQREGMIALYAPGNTARSETRNSKLEARREDRRGVWP
ncbi:MAG: PHP domain-containing protein, partial [Candidatus Acidiferrales bacterium]